MPPFRLDFPKSAHKMNPPPLGKFHFCHTPWKYYHFLCKPKISNFCSAKYRIFYPYFFFEKHLVDTVTNTSPEGTSPTSRMHIAEFAI